MDIIKVAKRKKMHDGAMSIKQVEQMDDTGWEGASEEDGPIFNVFPGSDRSADSELPGEPFHEPDPDLCYNLWNHPTEEGG